MKNSLIFITAVFLVVAALEEHEKFKTKIAQRSVVSKQTSRCCIGKFLCTNSPVNSLFPICDQTKLIMYFFKFFVANQTKEASRLLLEKLHWLTVGELVNFSPR